MNHWNWTKGQTGMWYTLSSLARVQLPYQANGSNGILLQLYFSFVGPDPDHFGVNGNSTFVFHKTTTGFLI